MKTQKEIENINSIPIDQYLFKLGIGPIRVNGTQKYYSSPYRTDKDPSFHLDTIKNQWYDHGNGKGGKLIQLVQELNNCSFIEACNIIEKLPSRNFVFHCNNNLTVPPVESKIIIMNETEITSRSLINYILSRKISLSIALKYCKEVTYTIKGNRYYSIGFKNNKGGYVLRSPGGSNTKGFKGCSSQDYTYINNNQPFCFVFEGFFNFLSLLTMWEAEGKSHSKNTDYLILNSVSNVERVESILQNKFTVCSCLDNDPAGNKATNLLRSFSSNFFVDYRIMYAGYNDLNDYLKDSIVVNNKNAIIRN